MVWGLGFRASVSPFNCKFRALRRFRSSEVRCQKGAWGFEIPLGNVGTSEISVAAGLLCFGGKNPPAP